MIHCYLCCINAIEHLRRTSTLFPKFKYNYGNWVFWYHVLERQALCSFVACLPTVLGISCYSCHEYLGSNQTCSSPSTSSCASYYDSCMTLRVTAQFMGLNISQTLKDCAISSTCSSTVVCDQVNSTISGTGITMLSCTLDCCSGDLCNGQGTSCYVCVCRGVKNRWNQWSMKIVDNSKSINRWLLIMQRHKFSSNANWWQPMNLATTFLWLLIGHRSANTNQMQINRI